MLASKRLMIYEKSSWSEGPEAVEEEGLIPRHELTTDSDAERKTSVFGRLLYWRNLVFHRAYQRRAERKNGAI